jgi:glycosyltransferase involved in cell wall biosynthesis
MSGEPMTPVVLTWNESPNIERTLKRLVWARRVFVLDSGSTDGTQELARRFPNVELAERPFDSHAAQWEAAIRHPAVETDWVLALDADYVLTPELVHELERLTIPNEMAGLRARFRYCIDGRPLRASLYPAVTVLFDRRRARYLQDGHTQRVAIVGAVGDLAAPIYHDDRKPFDRFVESQRRYAHLEAARVRATPFARLSWSGRLRKLRFASPVIVPLWLLFGRGLVLDGRRGLAYVRQRLVAERMIARALHDESEGSTS